MKTYAHYLHISDYTNLNEACCTIEKVYGPHLFLVGSCLYRPDYRDVDVRCMLPDKLYDRLFKDFLEEEFVGRMHRELLQLTISNWLSERTKLKVDFQFQKRSAANKQYGDRKLHKRNAVGISIKGVLL